MIDRQAGTVSSQVNSLKVCSLDSFKVFCVIMQDKSNIIFEVMFYIDEDFNN